MKRTILSIGLVLGSISFVNAQIGIATSSPTAALDVNGTVRVTNLPVGTTNQITLTGSASSRELNRTNLGANLIILNNELDTAPVAGSVGDFDLGAVPFDVGDDIFNLSLGLATGASNSRATFIRIHSYTATANISGFTDGIHGRHLTLYFSGTTGISLLEDSLLALPQNRILTSATSQLMLSGEGFVELVYDENAGLDGFGRWLVIKFRG